MRTGLACGLAVVLLFGAAPAHAADALLDTLSVDPSANTPETSDVILEPGTKYTMEVSGTFQATDVTGYGVYYDALYCYETVGAGTSACQHSGSNDKSNRGKRFAVRVGSSDWAAPDEFGSAGSTPHDTANEVPYREDHTYTVSFFAPQKGQLQAASGNGYPCQGCQAPYQGGPVVVKIYGPPGTTSHGGSKTCKLIHAHARAVQNEVRVVDVQPDVQYHKGGSAAGAWLPVEKDTVLKQGDEITVDPDGSATLAFADNSTVDVKNTTQLKIASFFTDGGVVRTEILLKMGEVAAQVCHAEATKSDFKIKSPTGVASVRGTVFSVFVDPGGKAMVTNVVQGVVTVDPAKPGLKTVRVKAGKEVEVTASSISRIAPKGKSDVRGGLSRRQAAALVAKVVAKNNAPCGLTTLYAPGLAVRPARGGWRVAYTVTGVRRGTTLWRVAHSRASPANALAREIARGCS